MEEFFDAKTTFDAKKEIVNSLGVYELRGLARMLGVKAPTTKKREELLSLVFSYMENEDVKLVNNSVKRGRPYKEISSMQSILDVISTGEDHFNESSNIGSFGELTVFNQDLPKIACQSSNIFPSSGVLRKGSSFGYFIDNSCQRIVYVPHEQIVKFNLESGDFLDCAVFEINNGTKCFVKKINRINGIVAEEHFAEEFNDYEQVFPLAKNVEGKSLSVGGRNVFLKSIPLYMNSFIKDLINCNKDAKIIVLGTNLCFEDKAFIFKDKQVFAFTSDYTDKITDGYDRILDSIAFTERLDKINEKVFLIVSDISSVLNVLDSYFVSDEKSPIYNHKEKTIIVVKKLISLAKAKSNEQNVTVLILCDKQDTNDDFIKCELLKISNILE